MRASLILTLLGLLAVASAQPLCGPKRGNCPDTYCCARDGTCGQDAASCRRAKGCRPEYGYCWNLTPSASSTISITATPTISTTATRTPSPSPVLGPISPDGSCGASNGGKRCTVGNCCSQYGYCGATAQHCGVGCQAAYGLCNGVPSPNPSPAVSPAVSPAASPAASPAPSVSPVVGPISTDGSCGAANGGKRCPSGNCCSNLGWCGSSALHCGAGCQSAYGICGASRLLRGDLSETESQTESESQSESESAAE